MSVCLMSLSCMIPVLCLHITLSVLYVCYQLCDYILSVVCQSALHFAGINAICIFTSMFCLFVCYLLSVYMMSTVCMLFVCYRLYVAGMSAISGLPIVCRLSIRLNDMCFDCVLYIYLSVCYLLSVYTFSFIS